jgi:hypothetical protein
VNEKKCREVVAARAGLGDPSMARCERCGQAPPLTAHHRVKRGQGGEWNPSNIVALCGHGTTGCHGWVESHPAAAGADGEGWALRRSEDPTEVPIFHHPQQMLVRLDDDGMLIPVDEGDSPGS